MSGLHRCERTVELGEVDAWLIRSLRHAEPATDVDYPHVGEALAQTREQRTGLLPVLHVEHAAAVVRVQADDAHAGRAGVARQLIELSERHTKLRMRAARANVMVMAPPGAGVDAHENLAA